MLLKDKRRHHLACPPNHHQIVIMTPFFSTMPLDPVRSRIMFLVEDLGIYEGCPMQKILG
jgi:hypothetical protein